MKKKGLTVSKGVEIRKLMMRVREQGVKRYHFPYEACDGVDHVLTEWLK